MSNNQAYITLMGRSGWAVVNSFYASVIETDYRPEKIHVIYESQSSEEVEPVIQGLKIIQSSYTSPDIQRWGVKDWDSLAAGETTLELVQNLKEEGYQVALDITGGRKSLVAGSLVALMLRDLIPDHIFYLAIEITQGVAKPYFMIPKRIQSLYDIRTNEVQTEKPKFKSKIEETDVILTRDCMMVLLNQAYSRGEKIVIKSPFVGTEILELDIQNSKVVMRTDRMSYEQNMDANKYEGSDHPSYSNLRRCLCYCGALDFENAHEITETLKSVGRVFDPTSGNRRGFLSLDSNMFYNGFPSSLEKLENDLGFQSKDIMCITPYAVTKEIRRRSKRKYTKKDILDAKDHYRSSHISSLLDELLGQSSRKTREAKMAISELLKYKNRPVHVTTEVVDVPSDPEDVDHLIVESLEKFSREKGASVKILSADKLLLNQCELADDVGIKILRFPQDIPHTMQVNDSTFVNILMGLAMLYGVVELEKIGYLFGEYRGKAAEAYAEEAKLRVRNCHRAQVLRERSDICEDLKQLGIPHRR